MNSIQARVSVFKEIYRRLCKRYGPQGWWPGDTRLEIIIGAILTQNTAWPNVEKVLRALAAAEALNPEAFLALPDPELATLIRPSGYHNTKARKLKELACCVRGLQGRTPTRSELLAVWGIGPETADSIRLYAYNQPEMVIDTYTQRVFERLGWVSLPISYDALKQYCVENLPADVQLYQEFHALIVEHSKRMKGRKAGDWLKPSAV